MTRATRRPNAARLAIQLAMLATLGSAIFGGCSSGAKTVPGDCGGTGALGGAETVTGGASSGASAGTLGMAADAGQGEGQAGAQVGEGGEGGGAAASSQGGESGDSSSNAGSSVGGHGGAGTAGHGGRTSSGGMSNTGGHGGSAGQGNGTGGQATAKCGDKVTTPPEFCDDGTNTDLSYGCYACTTLPPTAGASQGGAASVPEQCDKCLQEDSKPTSCHDCVDRRACYSCLRRQPDSFPPDSTFCSYTQRDDDPAGGFFTPQSLSDRCFNPNNKDYQSATGGPAGSEAAGLVCQALVECILRTGCAAGRNAAGGTKTVFSDCYCGSSCNTPNGPCVKEILDADAPDPGTLPSALAAVIGTHIEDSDPSPKWRVLGLAYYITACAGDPHGCADVCYPSSSSTGGAGGAAGSAGVGGNSGHGGS